MTDVEDEVLEESTLSNGMTCSSFWIFNKDQTPYENLEPDAQKSLRMDALKFIETDGAKGSMPFCDCSGFTTISNKRCTTEDLTDSFKCAGYFDEGSGVCYKFDKCESIGGTLTRMEDGSDVCNIDLGQSVVQLKKNDYEFDVTPCTGYFDSNTNTCMKFENCTDLDGVLNSENVCVVGMGMKDDGVATQNLMLKEDNSFSLQDIIMDLEPPEDDSAPEQPSAPEPPKSPHCPDGQIKLGDDMTCMAFKEMTAIENMNYFELGKGQSGFPLANNKIGMVPKSIQFGMEITEERNSAGQWSGLFTVTDDEKCKWGGDTDNVASFTLRNLGGTDKYAFFDQIHSKNKSTHVDHHFQKENKLTPGKYIVNREIKEENGVYKLITDIKNIENDSNKHMETVLDENVVQLLNNFDASKMHLCRGNIDVPGLKITDAVLK